MPPPESPRWSPNIKLVVALTLTAISAVVLISFRSILGPVLVAMIISYLFYPFGSFIHRHTHIPWRLVVGIFYLLTLLTLLGLLAWGGIFLLEQIQSLVNFIQKALGDFPNFLNNLLETPIEIGPFRWDLRQINIENVVNAILGIVQPWLAQVGNLVGSLASGFAGIVGWTIFALLLSYFITSETEEGTRSLLNVKIPGYTNDVIRMREELSRIWNAFLRGQLIVFLMVVAIYTFLLTLLGVQYAFGLSLVAGLARFIPYIGGFFSWTANGLVAISQGFTLFGLASPGYALMVLIFGWVTDAIIDNLISPRIFSNALKIHPAAVMVVALIGFNVLGIVGVILAAPGYATIKLMIDYTVRKLFDQDPWADIRRVPKPPPLSIEIKNGLQNAWTWLHQFSGRVIRWVKKLRKSQL